METRLTLARGLVTIAMMACISATAKDHATTLLPRHVGTPTSQLLDALRSAMTDILRDPYSAVISDTYTVYTSKSIDDPILCGAINAKNLHGAYVGKVSFAFVGGSTKGGAGSLYLATDDARWVAALCRRL